MQKFSYVGKYEDSGSRNSFYKLKNSKYGFKSYPNKSLAEFGYEVQSCLSLNDFAPKVYSPVCKIRVPNWFMVKNKRGDYVQQKQMVLSDWGYLTEIAKPYVCDSDYCDNDCSNNSCCDNYITIDIMLGRIEEYYGLEYIDSHEANLGFVTRKGKKTIVIVDVGREGFGDIGDFTEPVWDGEYGYA